MRNLSYLVVLIRLWWLAELITKSITDAIPLHCNANATTKPELNTHSILKQKQLKDVETTKHLQKLNTQGDVLLIPFDGLLELLLRRLPPKLYR